MPSGLDVGDEYLNQFIEATNSTAKYALERSRNCLAPQLHQARVGWSGERLIHW